MNIYNPIIVLILYISVFIFPGYVVLSFFDSTGWYYHYAFGDLGDFNINKFYLTLLLCVGPILAYLFFSVKKNILNFKNKITDLTNLKSIYMTSILILILINFYFFVSFNFSIPAISIAGLVTADTYGALRSNFSSGLSSGIFNIGLFFFGFGSVLSGLLLIEKSYLYILISIFLCLLMLMFNLAKSPILDFLFLCTLGYLFIENKKINFLLISLVVFFLGFSLIAFISPGFTALRIFESLVHRVFLGEISDLPTYFSFFADNPQSYISILPPYVQNLFGYDYASSAKVVAVSTTAFKNIFSVGYYNTIFIGEAFAVMGPAGLFISPFIVILNFAILGFLIKKSPKNIFTIIFLSFILFKLTKGIFSGIGLFIFSTNQIFMILLLFYLFIHKKNMTNIV